MTPFRRRGFLGILTAGVAAALDPEELLWKPGKFFSIPKARQWPAGLVPGDLISFPGVAIVNPATYEIIEKGRVFVVTAVHELGKASYYPEMVFDGNFMNVAAPKGRYSSVPERVDWCRDVEQVKVTHPTRAYQNRFGDNGQIESMSVISGRKDWR